MARRWHDSKNIWQPVIVFECVCVYESDGWAFFLFFLGVWAKAWVISVNPLGICYLLSTAKQLKLSILNTPAHTQQEHGKQIIKEEYESMKYVFYPSIDGIQV